MVARRMRAIGPWRLKGNVVRGFQRGSKQLGWPTANLDPKAFEHDLDQHAEGVYVGFAKTKDDQVHKAVLSLGWNPFYTNEQRTLEAYIDHKYDADFYGAEMTLLVCAFVRPQQDFSSLEELVDAISADISFGLAQLDQEPWCLFRHDDIFSAT